MRELRIEDPIGWWESRGYAGMVPSIHLPTTHDRDDLIHVWLRVPEGTTIDAEYLPEPSRWCLLFPPGTRSDRAEYYRVGGHRTSDPPRHLDSPLTDPDAWTLGDVRGTQMAETGEQGFHVLRPMDGSAHAPMRGWARPRGNAQAQAEATQRLIDRARPDGRVPIGYRDVAAGLAAGQCPAGLRLAALAL